MIGSDDDADESSPLECAGSDDAAVAPSRVIPREQKTRIQVWLFENTDLRIEGKIIGFDEYMNLVLDEAEELSIKKKTRKDLGRILLKGDNITLMMAAAS